MGTEQEEVSAVSDVMEATESQKLNGLAISFKFPLGRYHATPMGTAANDGVVEWPPSPWRIIRALYSVWKTRCTELPESDVMQILNALATPPDYSLPTRHGSGHTRHYMPIDNNTKGKADSKVWKAGPRVLVSGDQAFEKTMLVLDAFNTCNSSDQVVVHWPTVTLTERQRDVLSALCSQLTWLGRAESLCDAELVDGEMPVTNTWPAQAGYTEGDRDLIRLLVPTQPVDEESITVNLEKLRTDNKSRAVQPPGSTYVTYSRPTNRRATPNVSIRADRPPIEAFRFEIVPAQPGRQGARLPMRDLLLYTAALRVAAQSLFGKATNGTASKALSGRDESSILKGHSHAHFLALPAMQGGVASPWIDSFIVWAPSGFEAVEQAAIHAIKELRGFDFISEFKRVNLICNGVSSIHSLLPEWLQARPEGARVWKTVTPMVPGRYAKKKWGWATQIERELEVAIGERGLGRATVESITPWEGRYRTVRPRLGRPPHRAHPYPHDVTIVFEEPVSMVGPLSLGAQSHFGLGLFMPIA